MRNIIVLILFFVFYSASSQEKGFTLKELDSMTQNDAETLPVLAKSIKYPIYRGCHKFKNYEKAYKCTIQKLKEFIQLSYDFDVADRALPYEDFTNFEISFIVNKKGKVEKVTAKANHRAVAIEAIRTAQRIPKFKIPGMLNGSPRDTPMTFTTRIEF